MDGQLFTFIFAFVLFLAGVVLMWACAIPGVKRVEELNEEYNSMHNTN